MRAISLRGSVDISSTSSQEIGLNQPPDCPRDFCAALRSGTIELNRLRQAEADLSESLARERLLVEQKDDLICHKDLMSRESDHRLMNGLQMVTSLLSMQSRMTQDKEAAAQLKIAASRISTIGSVHRSLHALDHIDNVDLTTYLKTLCKDISLMLSGAGGTNALTVEGIPVKVPSATGIPLGFIVSELVMNSAKYGAGKITVKLGNSRGNGYALSVSDCGPGLPKGFDPNSAKGLGMRIVLSLVDQIGGKLRFAAGDNKQGTCFTVLFH